MNRSDSLLRHHSLHFTLRYLHTTAHHRHIILLVKYTVHYAYATNPRLKGTTGQPWEIEKTPRILFLFGESLYAGEKSARGGKCSGDLGHERAGYLNLAPPCWNACVVRNYLPLLHLPLVHQHLFNFFSPLKSSPFPGSGFL